MSEAYKLPYAVRVDQGTGFLKMAIEVQEARAGYAYVVIGLHDLYQISDSIRLHLCVVIQKEEQIPLSHFRAYVAGRTKTDVFVETLNPDIRMFTYFFKERFR